MKLFLLFLLALNHRKPVAVANAQIVLDPVEARRPENDWVKPCSPSNHDSACYDPKLPHIINHLYNQKENCEKYGGMHEPRAVLGTGGQASF